VSRKTISERFNTANSVSPKSTTKNTDQGNGNQDDIGNYFPPNISAVVNKNVGQKVFNQSTGAKDLVLSHILQQEAKVAKR